MSYRCHTIAVPQIDDAPEPLRRLGKYLANLLDEDQWPTAEILLLGAIASLDDRDSPDQSAPAGTLTIAQARATALGCVPPETPINDRGTHIIWNNCRKATT